jgi:hypothetical protein
MGWNASAAVDPATGQPITKWEGNLTLSPDQQAALDAQQKVQQGRSELAQGFMGRVGEAYKDPMDYSKMPAAPGSIEESQQNAYGLMSKMFEPGRTQQREALDNRLAAMGVDANSEAYKRQQANLGEQFGRQDLMAGIEAMNQGRQQASAQQGLRQSAIAEEAQRRGMSLNEMNALLTGQQVNMPQMPQFNAASAGQAPNFLGAAQAQGQYGLNQWQANQNSGPDIGSLLGTAAGAAFMFSDVRLKSRIVRVGEHPLGVGVYEYDIFGRRERGVLAHEVARVAPALVRRHVSGYLMVNYGGL